MGLLAAPGAGRAQDDVQTAHPLEPVNRPVWNFNDALDRYALKPVARSWRWLTPVQLRRRLDNVFRNLEFPRRFVNDLLQADVQQAGIELGRFTLNTTVGLAGIFDPAARYGLNARDEDFGQTLGSWGAPDGAYLMLPILGPSGVRDVVGLPLDLVLGMGPSLLNPWVGAGVGVTDRVNLRAQNLDQVEDARASALDEYVFVRNLYKQRRATLIRNGDPAEGPGDDFYDLEDE